MREEITRLQSSLEEAQQTARDAEARHQTFQKEKTDLLDQLERSRYQLLSGKDELRSKEEQINDLMASGQRNKQQLAAMELQVADAQRQQCLLQTALNDLRRDREALLRSKTGLEADVKRHQQEKLDLEAKLQLSIEDRAKKASELQHEQRMRKEREGELDSLRLASHEAQFAFQKAQETALLAESQHRKLASDIESKERQNEDLTKQLISLRQDKELVEEELARTRRTLDGRDGDLHAAQQHLAKKVKESARLTERVEENGQRIHDLELSNEDLKKRYATLEAETDKYRKREKEIEDRAQQRILEAQAAATRWESEYARMYTQWQQSEDNNKKLRAMEVKYKQVSAVLAGLLDAPQAASLEPSVKPVVTDQATPTAPQPPMEDQDLFSQQPQKRAKRNLFDP
jgi:chromosome segregation ATPase